jgi:hypothetical protein
MPRKHKRLLEEPPHKLVAKLAFQPSNRQVDVPQLFWRGRPQACVAVVGGRNEIFGGQGVGGNWLREMRKMQVALSLSNKR